MPGLQLTEEGNLIGGRVRPQTTARCRHPPWHRQQHALRPRCPSWRPSATFPSRSGSQRCAIPPRRAELIAEADAERQVIDPASVFVLAGPDARYDCTPDDSLAAGVEAA